MASYPVKDINFQGSDYGLPLCTIMSNLFYAVKIIFIPPIYMATINEYSSKKKVIGLI